MFHDQSKHIETRYHYVRKMMKEGRNVNEYVPSEKQAVDIFTKGFSSGVLTEWTPMGMKNSMWTTDFWELELRTLEGGNVKEY